MKRPDFELENFDEEKLNLFSKIERANFINSLTGFKSANLIGSYSPTGETNLAIFSSAVHIGADPALIGLIFRPNTVPRHTLENFRSTKICTLNHVNEAIFKKAHQTSARYSKEQSEFEMVGLTPEYLKNIKAPFVKESHLKMSLEFIREVPIHENNTQMIITQIKEIFLPKNIISDDGHVTIEDISTVCVGGLSSYFSTKPLGRLPYAKP